MVRSVPRASGGFRRLAASPVPAAPPAPINVWASSMNRMIGVGELCTSSITERRRCSNSPFIEAPACIRPMSSAQSRTPRSGGGTSPAAIRCANPSTTAVLPTPASPVRIGLFCRRRISTSINLADFFVPTKDRIHLARFGLGGEILREPVERRRPFGLAWAAPSVPRRQGPSRPSAAWFPRRSRPRRRGARRPVRRR